MRAVGVLTGVSQSTPSHPGSQRHATVPCCHVDVPCPEQPSEAAAADETVKIIARSKTVRRMLFRSYPQAATSYSRAGTRSSYTMWVDLGQH